MTSPWVAHAPDFVVVAGYLVVVVLLGRRGARTASKSEEGFFLANRKLGKVYQFFLNFGNATDPQGAVSTASLVYQQGVSGVWLSFQTIFMNPYYWFMNTWYRRVRLVTVSDLFEDRLQSRGLSRVYAVFQIGVAVILIGFGNLVAYKITSSLLVKPAEQWTPAERATVEGHAEKIRLGKAAGTAGFTAADARRLAALQEADARGELPSYITIVNQWAFYLGFTLVVGAYVILGGMQAAAVNEALQGVLIVVFSLLLLPTGFAAIGGWRELGARVPAPMFDLFGTVGEQQFSVWTVLAILLVSLVQIHGLSANMGIFGSARNEQAARFGGVAGTYMKRIMIILWALAGLLALALFSGPEALSDPDAAWGAMSNRLLRPGLIGFMLAGVLAATMSNMATKAMAISSLFVRNLYHHLRPDASAARSIRAGRYAIAGVLMLGVLAAGFMHDVASTVKLILLVNVPFGAIVFLVFFWRRLTAAAAWWSLVASTLVLLIVPAGAEHVRALHQRPALLETAPDARGLPAAVYWTAILHASPGDPVGGPRGIGRFNLECWILGGLGVPVRELTPAGRFTAQFFFDGIFPFVVLAAVSCLTRPPPRARVDEFFGKMKTPVQPSPELDAQALEETRRSPGRFDHTKLWPKSAWEFTRWNREDMAGFLGCCALSGAILAGFAALLHLLS